jgi:integrase
MARQIHKLSPAAVKNAKPGMHADGGGLYLQATRAADDTISRSWIFRFALKGRERHMGIGSLQSVGLAVARQRAADARKLREQGIDPIEARNESRATAAASGAKQGMTFDACRDAYVAAHRAGWGNVKHAAQWPNSLEAYASPVFGKLAVRGIDTALVLKVLEPIWQKKTETASRVRGRIESVLDWAKVRGYRDGENPARWRGHLDHLLPARSDIKKVRHHAALPYVELPVFLASLRGQQGIAARALEFTILTAARTGEVIRATASEINRREKIWTISAERMKAGKEHRVPLTDRALAIIDDVAPLRGNGAYLFPSARGGLFHDRSMLDQLERMGRTDLTVHGFRSTFRDWAAERTNFSSEVVEMALAHVVGNKVEAAYRRGDLFEKRRRLMDAWGEYCLNGRSSAEVLPLRALDRNEQSRL